jgi:hypothetical protein
VVEDFEVAGSYGLPKRTVAKADREPRKQKRPVVRTYVQFSGTYETSVNRKRVGMYPSSVNADGKQ